MKRFWTLLMLLCSTAVFLMACSDNQAAEAVVPTDAPGTAVGFTPEANQTASGPITDLSLIGQTGRPQLLNAYASW